MSITRLRLEIGDPYISGHGIEIGAGLCPVFHTNAKTLNFYDKRNREEFKDTHGKYPDYDLVSKEWIRTNHPDGVDFLCAHHVLEHAVNPIKTLVEWIDMIKFGGVLYISIPSEHNVCEKDRPITPARHILEDFLFDRSEDSYESREHIFSFALQWSMLHEEVRPWYSKGDVQLLSSALLSESRRSGHDLHWHTLTLDAATQILECGFYFAGSGQEWLEQRSENEGSHYLVARKIRRWGPPPIVLDMEKQLLTALNKLVKDSRL